MNIAITSTGSTLEAPVCTTFAQTPYLLIIDVESMTCTAIPHTVAPGSDEQLARTILAHNCEAVITGTLAPAPFAILADAMITRFRTTNLSARQALAAMDNRSLELIRNADGSGTCAGDHHHN